MLIVRGGQRRRVGLPRRGGKVGRDASPSEVGIGERGDLGPQFGDRERPLDREVAHGAVADARTVLDVGLDIDRIAEVRVRDVVHLDHDPVSSRRGGDQFAVRTDRGIDVGRLTDRAAGAAHRRIGIGTRGDEPDAGIVERTDREQESERRARRFKRISRYRLVAEVLHLVGGFVRGPAERKDQYERKRQHRRRGKDRRQNSLFHKSVLHCDLLRYFSFKQENLCIYYKRKRIKKQAFGAKYANSESNLPCRGHQIQKRPRTRALLILR